MSHGPSTEWGKDGAAQYKSRLGIVMFCIYLVVYAGFIIINVFEPTLMKTDVGSLNLAIVYGFGLIAFAVVLAVIYNHLCTRAEKKAGETDEEEIALNPVETNGGEKQ
ncbi:MAG: DUF485 domain-containing protein [Bacillota bacterium]